MYQLTGEQYLVPTYIDTNIKGWGGGHYTIACPKKSQQKSLPVMNEDHQINHWKKHEVIANNRRMEEQRIHALDLGFMLRSSQLKGNNKYYGSRHLAA